MENKLVLTPEQALEVQAIMSAGTERPPPSIGELKSSMMADPTVSVSDAAYRIEVETMVRRILSAGRPSRAPQPDTRVPAPASADKPPRDQPPAPAAPAPQAAPIASKSAPPPKAPSPAQRFREMPGRVLVVDEDIPDVLAHFGLTMAQLEDLNLGPVLRAQRHLATSPHWIRVRPRSESHAGLVTRRAG